jgi:Aerotolerance regulator N-terminal/von Willebrand factor type A domain
MSFLTPLYLLGGVLVALPIVLHLLRRDVAPPVPFTAVHLLRKTAVERSRRHRLRDLLLLAARVAALLLLAASFARPYRAAAPGTSRMTVVAVDRSFSMASPARIARARELARQAIDEARGDRIAVVAFDERADVVSGSGTAADARAAVAAIETGFGATRYAAALDKAAELLLDENAGRVVIVSDLQRSGFDQSGAVLPEGIDLVVRDAGAATGNLSVSNAAIERRQVIVTVHNDDSTPHAVDVSVVADGRALPVRQVTVAPQDAVDVPFEAAGDVRTARAAIASDLADAYAADNERYAVRDARALPRVLVVSGASGSTSGFYLTRALLAEGNEGPDFEVRSVTGQAFSSLTAAQLRDESAIAILSTHGLDRRAGEALRTYLESGGGLLIAAAPDVDPVVLSTLLNWTPALAPRERQNAGVLAATDLRHPILRPFDALAANLGQVTFDRVWQVDTSRGWRVVARFTNGDAALAERTGGSGRVLLFTSDVDRRWNDFPLHASFVPFTQEAARYLGARAPVLSTFLIADVPKGIAPRPGFVERAGRTLAVNVDPRESRVERVTASEFRSLVTRTASQARPRAQRLAAQTEGQQNYWRYGLMLMLAALVVEAVVGSR